jgi:hypothetical protein
VVGPDAIELTYKDAAGKVGNELLYRDRETDLQVVEEGRPWRDDLLFTQFADKNPIIRKSPDFTGSKRKFEDELSKVQNLRDSLAHVNDCAAPGDAAARTSAIVRGVEHWIAHWNAWLPEGRGMEQGK